METFILWVGFAGAWLLFAGPIYQAALELQDEDIEVQQVANIRELQDKDIEDRRIYIASARVQKPKGTSLWWWLLPPVKLYQEFKRRADYQRRFMEALSQEDIEAIVSYRSKANAWLFVSVGGFCIACKETYELASHEGWSILGLLFIIVGMLILSILHLVTQMKRARMMTKS